MQNNKSILTTIPEWLWVLFLSFYIGVILNLPVFYRKVQIGSEVVALDVIFAIVMSWVLLCLSGLFGRKVMRIFGVIILILSSIAAYYMWVFNIVIGYGIIQATFGTELSLVAESTGYKLLLFVLFLGLVPSYYFFKQPIKLDSSWIKRYVWRGIFILIALLGLKTLDHYYHSFRHPLADGRIPTNPFGVAAHSYLPTNWIAASAMAMANYEVNRNLQQNLIDPSDLFEFTEQVNLDDVYLVFVIGESARSDRMSLLGADRETTPLLEAEENVIAFNGTSCNTITKLSLDCMFVRRGGVEEKGPQLQQFVHERNIFNVMKKMGFSIELFAMQAEAGFYNKVGADSYKVREEIGAQASLKGISAIDDYLLVDQTRQSIKQHPKGRHIVLLHTKGSHYLYTNRYTRKFAKFKPECNSIDDNCSESTLYNSYDNTILYTDYILDSIIDLLRDKKALLIYTSDHGESIDEGTHFHGAPKHIAPPEQREVPVIMWASDSFLKVPELANAFAAAKAKEELKQNVEHEDIFESMLGCLGYQSSDGGIRPENNWCSPQAMPLNALKQSEK